MLIGKTALLVPSAHFITSFIFFLLLAGLYLGCLILRALKNNRGSSIHKNHSSYSMCVTSFLLEIINKPFLTASFLFFIHVAVYFIFLFLPFYLNRYREIISYTVGASELLIFFWLTLNLLTVGKTHLLHWLLQAKKTTLHIIISMISSSLQAVIFLCIFNIIIPQMGITGLSEEILSNSTKLLLIGTIGWIFIQLINGTEKLILAQTSTLDENGWQVRRIYTQIVLLKKIFLGVVVVITLAAGLMVFESVRSLGTGLLTTAGIIGAAGAFASQQSLSRLLMGLQLAFTQPIRLGDAIIIENEMGQVEEITLSYIVIKLWDLRRLIVPSNYFFTTSVQNLTRESTELLGTIFLYADYTLPIAIVRQKFLELVEVSTFWNHNTAAFQVTDIKQDTMELRALVSAKDSGTLWSLRCEIREKLINFIVENYPQSLPVKRNIPLTP